MVTNGGGAPIPINRPRRPVRAARMKRNVNVMTPGITAAYGPYVLVAVICCRPLTLKYEAPLTQLYPPFPGHHTFAELQSETSEGTQSASIGTVSVIIE